MKACFFSCYIKTFSSSLFIYKCLFLNVFKEPLAVVMEYAAYGSLKNVLRMCKSYMANEMVISEKETDFLLSEFFLDSCCPMITAPQLWRFALQVAKGMEYLASRKVSQQKFKDSSS